MIDACVYEIAPHKYKLWYKDEEKDSRTYAAVSEDLYNWEVLGAEVTDCAQEGSNVFEFNGRKWLISDIWQGLAVYCSDDYSNWIRCGTLLTESGIRPLDQGFGHHADVVVRDGRAYLFYFCHPFSCEADKKQEDICSIEPRDRSRSAIQVVELTIKGEGLSCDRNAPVRW